MALRLCPTQPVSTPFSQWGDTNDYFLVPGGSFEGTADQVGWTLSSASLTRGNEPFNVNGSGDSQSLTINGGGSATSPYFCVDNTMSGLRFFAQQADAGNRPPVRALVQTSDGVPSCPLADLADGSMPAWAPTEPRRVGDASRRQLAHGGAALPRPGPSGSWQIDDVYVDPYRSG